MYNIGDFIWVARAGQTEKYITCPDCFGTLKLKVILGNGEELSIPCAGCSIGYDPPTGRIKTYEFDAEPENQKIIGIEIQDNITYHVGNNVGDSCYRLVEERDAFKTYNEALERSKQIKEEKIKEEQIRLARKEHETRSWAWHVHYYRKQIRDAESTIEYARERLGIALPKAKKEKA